MFESLFRFSTEKIRLSKRFISNIFFVVLSKSIVTIRKGDLFVLEPYSEITMKFISLKYISYILYILYHKIIENVFLRYICRRISNYNGYFPGFKKLICMIFYFNFGKISCDITVVINLCFMNVCLLIILNSFANIGVIISQKIIKFILS